MNRFERLSLHILPEHAEELVAEHPDGRQVRTRVLSDRTRSVINAVADSPDIPFAWSINPYRGCEHGCSYCYARPFHEHLGLSAGLDFETVIVAKRDAPELLKRELAKRSWRGEPIVLSGVTDPYQPVEAKLRITRGVLEVCHAVGQPVSLITKNRLITRDIDLLGELARDGRARAAISITTLDPDLARRMEPRASVPRDRLRAVRELSEAGVPVAVMAAPIVPGLNDRQIPAILEAAAEAGATSAGWVLLRLPHGVKELFLDWLAREFPDRAGKVESLVRQAHDGKLYDPAYGQRQRGSGRFAESIRTLFDLACRRHGLNEKQWGGIDADPGVSERARRLWECGGQMGLFG